MPTGLPALLADGLATAMFHLGPTILEKVLRPVIVYAFLILLLRVFGKRELAQLNPFDLVVLLCLSNTVQNAIIGEDNSVTGGLIGALSLCAINYLVIRFLFRHRRLDQIIEGQPETLIKDGKMIHEAMAREMITRGELLLILHRQGFRAIEDVANCTIEPGGSFVIEAREPGIADRRHAELLDRIERLTKQVEALTPRHAVGPDATRAG